MTKYDRNVLICGDSKVVLSEFEENAFDTCVTSPPYYKCRTYPNGGDLGHESSPTEYVENLAEIFDAVKNTLRPTGTLWLNIGDRHSPKNYKDICIRSGELMGLPGMMISRLRESGWILQDRIIWHKPNAMPSSVKMHFTPDFEEILVFSKSKKFFFEQQFEPLKLPSAKTVNAPRKHALYGRNTYSGFSYNAEDHPLGRNKRAVWSINTAQYRGSHTAVFPKELVVTPILAGSPERVCNVCGFQSKIMYSKHKNAEWESKCGADKSGSYSGKSVKDYKRTGAQDASEMKRRILENMRERRVIGLTRCEHDNWSKSVVLDPFVGSGTVPIVATFLGRDYVGIDIDKTSIAESISRMSNELKPVPGPKKVAC